MHVSFERTGDLSIVRSILVDPAIWPHVTDDHSGRKENFWPNADERIWYVLALENEGVVGLFTFLPRSKVLWECHVALRRKGRATHGTEIAAEALRWMFEHSTARKFVAEIPASNKLACRMAGVVMDRVGMLPAAFEKRGKLENLVLFGLSKPMGEKRKCRAS